METDDEFIDIELRSAEAVARRCVVFAALLRLAAVEMGASDDPALTSDDPETDAFDLREWLRGEELWRDLTLGEAMFVERPVAKRSTAPSPDPLSLGESFATLAWALGLVPGIAPLAATDIRDLILVVPEPWQSTRSWLDSQHLRPELEIARQRELAELWEWRLASELARRESRGRARDDIDASIIEVRREAVAAELLTAHHARDGLVDWDSVTRRESDELAAFHAMAEQRLRALNWVCGFGETWDDVPLEV